MTPEEEPTYYESDSPCRRCNGVTRYRNTSHKGQCAGCVTDEERDRRATHWVRTTRATTPSLSESDNE